MRRRRARPEQALQRTVAQYLDLAGGYRNAIEGAIFKSLGVKAGVPDLAI